MDAETLKALGAKVRGISVTYSRKIWGDIGGSLGAEIGLEADVNDAADYEAVANALYESAKNLAADNMKPALEAMQKVRDVPQPKQEAYMLPSEPPGLPEPERVQVDDSGAEYKTFECDHFTVHEMDGKRSAKIFGGAYKKFGVRAYPEVMATAGVDIVACNTGVEYKMPKGITQAVAILNDKGNPAKVVRFV